MTSRYLTLSARIRDEISDLDRTQAAVQRHWTWALTAGDHQDAYLNSVALNLHAFYSGIERIFDLVAADVDGGRPTGGDWHVEFLRQMTLDVESVRPAVISRETAAALDDYRRFRHLIRNIYATNLDPERLTVLVRKLPPLWVQLRSDLERLSDFLSALASNP